MFHDSQMREEGHNVRCSQVPGMQLFLGRFGSHLCDNYQ